METAKKLSLLAVVMLVIVAGLAPWARQSRAQFKLPSAQDLDNARRLLEAGKDVAEAAKPWTYPEERATGRVMAAQVAANLGGVWKNQAWNTYVNEIGRALVLYSNRPDVKYRFAILNTDDINAYSCPGGYIFVTRGILKQLSNEAQLAGILAHEIGHSSERHIEKEIKKQKVGGALLQHGLSFAASQGNITNEQAMLIKGVSDAGYKILVEKGYARADEFEADWVGTQNIYKLGYTPYGLYAFLKRLRDAEGQKTSQWKILTSTHPAADQRTEKLKQLIGKAGMSDSGINLQDRYQDMLAKHPIP